MILALSGSAFGAARGRRAPANRKFLRYGSPNTNSMDSHTTLRYIFRIIILSQKKKNFSSLRTEVQTLQVLSQLQGPAL